MKNSTIFSAVMSFVAFFGIGVAQAGDFITDEYNDKVYNQNVYKDRSYIDKTLDDFERRTGQYRTGKYEQDQYNDNFVDDGLNDNRTALLNKGTKDYDLQKDYTLKNDSAENCERREQVALKCLHPSKIRRRLVRRGWHEFRILKDGASRIRMVARDYDGRRFKLVVSRCRGNIIKLKPLHGFGGWQRPYYY